jgi:hypothetical protein
MGISDDIVSQFILSMGEVVGGPDGWGLGVLMGGLCLGKV